MGKGGEIFKLVLPALVLTYWPVSGGGGKNMFKAVLFDAYGTLLDVDAAAAQLAVQGVFPNCRNAGRSSLLSGGHAS